MPRKESRSTSVEPPVDHGTGSPPRMIPQPVLSRWHERRWQVLLILVVLVVITHIPLIVSGYPRGHDAAYHLKWLYHFSSQLLAGDLYPRWLMGMSGGLGGPSFYYYPPAAYYVSSFFSLFIDPMAHGHHVLAATALFAALIGTLGVWAFCRAWLTHQTCLFACIVFLVFPYRLVVDLYMRGDIAELLGISVIPWLFLTSLHVRRSAGAVLAVTTLSTAAAVLTHPLVAMIALPFAFLFRLLDAMQSDRSRSLLAIQIVATGLGMALSAFYIVPALLVENPASGGWDLFIVYDSFLFDRPVSPVPLVATMALFAILTSAFLSVVAWALWVLWRQAPRDLGLFFLISSVIATGMLFEISAPVYRWFPPLERLQFPWRYTTLLTVFATFALAFVCHHLQFQRPRSSRFGTGLLIALPLAWFFLALVVGWHRGADGFDVEENRTSIARSHDAPEYRLSALARQLPSMSDFDGFPRVLVPEGNAVDILEWSENDIVLAGDFPAGEPVLLGRQYFAEWYLMGENDQGTSNSQPVENVDGLLSVTPTDHLERLHIVRREFAAVSWGNRISNAALILFICLLLIGRLVSTNNRD